MKADPHLLVVRKSTLVQGNMVHAGSFLTPCNSYLFSRPLRLVFVDVQQSQKNTSPVIYSLRSTVMTVLTIG